MSRHRIAIIGLGMAVTPHAKSLLDLKDRVEVVYAMTPSAVRRQAFADRFAFPTTDSLERIVDDRSITAAAVLTPPNTHLEIVEELARAGKHILLEKPLDVSTARAERLVGACREAGVTLGVVLQHRFKPAAERLAAVLREEGLGRIVNCSTAIRVWRPQSYYDEPGQGHQGARRRRRAADPGHPHARPDAEPRRPGRGRVRLRPHHARASHGDGRPGVGRGALRQRRPRRDRRDDGGLPGRRRTHRPDRHQGYGIARRHGAHLRLS